MLFGLSCVSVYYDQLLDYMCSVGQVIDVHLALVCAQAHV